MEERSSVPHGRNSDITPNTQGPLGPLHVKPFWKFPRLHTKHSFRAGSLLFGAEPVALPVETKGYGCARVSWLLVFLPVLQYVIPAAPHLQYGTCDSRSFASAVAGEKMRTPWQQGAAPHSLQHDMVPSLPLDLPRKSHSDFETLARGSRLNLAFTQCHM